MTHDDALSYMLGNALAEACVPWGWQERERSIFWLYFASAKITAFAFVFLRKDLTFQ